MIYPNPPPPPRDPMRSVFTFVYGTILASFLIAVAALVVSVAISARNSLDTPTVSAFPRR